MKLPTLTPQELMALGVLLILMALGAIGLLVL